MLDETKILRKGSSRHHYIPEFISKAFTNEDGKLFVFDKAKNQILKSQKVPKSIFFEWDRNTVELKDGIESSFIEDFIYSSIDSTAGRIIKNIQNKEIANSNLNFQEAGHIGFFLIALFWRIPYTDKISENAINNLEVTSEHINTEVLRRDPTFKKIQRVLLPKHTIDKMLKRGKEGKFYVNIHTFENECFLLGDNPVLFRNPTSKFLDLFNSDYLFAVSSKRIFSSTEEAMNNFSGVNAFLYNAAIIDQASRFVCSSSIRLLENSLQIYSMIKKNDWLQSKVEECFASTIT